MNINLQLDGMVLKLEDLGQEAGLDALALLINSGVIPAVEDWYEIEEEEDGQLAFDFGCLAEEPCGDTIGFCPCEEEDEDVSPEEVFVEILETLAEAVEAAVAEAVKEQEIEQAKQAKEEEKHEKIPAEFEELFNHFFGAIGKK